MKTYQVRNWKQFQHYKDRNPPWIKLHFALLASEDWVSLDDASKLLAVVCMLVASRNDGKVPNNPAYLKRVAYLDALPDLTPLIECGFLSETLADASTQQADARPERETEESRDRAEGERTRAPAVRLSEDWTAGAEDRAYAKAQGVPEDLIDREQSKFRNHYHGNGQTRVDWSAAWRKWIDGTCEKAGYKPGNVLVIVGSVPSIAISTKDTRWKACADRWQREHGKPPKPIPSDAYPEGSKLFPSDWEETRISPAVAAA